MTVSLDAIAIFVEVVRARSFSEAARRLGIPKSTVSVRVAELEARLGVALVHRTTRKVQATQAGEAYFASAERTLADLHSAEIEVSRAQHEPSGILRVTSAGFETGDVSRHLAAYSALYPQVHVDLLLTDQKLDLVTHGIDVGFRIGAIADTPSLIARRIGSVQRALYAAPGYLKQQRAPTEPSELARHALLLPKLDGELTLVHTDGGRTSLQLSARIVANHPAALRYQVLRGLGIALLPTNSADEDVQSGLMRRVLADWATPLVPVSVLYAAQRYLPQRVRLFVDLVLQNSKAKARR